MRGVQVRRPGGKGRQAPAGQGRRMTSSEIAAFLAGFAVILGLARLLGHLARMLKQPAVIGEIVAGILLGPTLFGTFFPELSHQLFPGSFHFKAAFNALATLSMCLLLVVG